MKTRLPLVLAALALVAAMAPPTAAARHSPFSRALPIPETLTAKDLRDGPITIRRSLMRILPGRRTRMWTYGGSFPGPTIRLRSGRQAAVTFRNRLRVPLSVHHHGGHQPSSQDGQPVDFPLLAGRSRTYRYPLRQAGKLERAGFRWYHDHRMDATARNVWRGMAGMLIVSDPYERRLNLPRGRYDVPLMLVDRRFNRRNQLVDPHPAGGPAGGEPPSDEVVGDHNLVNGVPEPFFDVADRTYRLRLLNASNFRTYTVFMGDGRAMKQIAGDGGLLPAAVSRRRITLGPAERAEVVVNFRGRLGKRITLRSSAGRLLQFRVRRHTRRGPAVPRSLRPPPAIGTVPAKVTRTFSFDLGMHPSGRAAWTINGRTYDHMRVDARPRLGTTERWRLTNPSRRPHVVHLHNSYFTVLSRDGAPPPPWERGTKDSMLLEPGQSAEVAVKFQDHTGRFVLHCHMLEHEDNGMMATIEVVAGGPTALAAAPPLAAFLLLIGWSLRDRVRARRRELAGSAALVGVALTHLADLPSKVGHAPYMAVLFGLCAAAALTLAALLARGRATGLAWPLAAALCAAALIGYAVSRSYGLPLMEDHVGLWLDPAAVAAVGYEVAILCLALAGITPFRPAVPRPCRACSVSSSSAPTRRVPRPSRP